MIKTVTITSPQTVYWCTTCGTEVVYPGDGTLPFVYWECPHRYCSGPKLCLRNREDALENLYARERRLQGAFARLTGVKRDDIVLNGTATYVAKRLRAPDYRWPMINESTLTGIVGWEEDDPEESQGKE